jgi:predicted RecA/RadA family phage recombinase
MTSNPPATAKLVGDVDVFDYVVPTGQSVNSGDVLQVAGLAGVALDYGREGEPVAVDVCRAFRFPNPDVVAAVGTAYGWSIAEKKIVTSGAGDFELGRCIPTVKNPETYGTGVGAVIALNR